MMLIDAKLSAQLERFGQPHVLQTWPNLTEAEQARLSEQLTHVDWHLIDTYLSELSSPVAESTSSTGKVAPPAHVVRAPKTEADLLTWKSAAKLGEEALQAGKVGVVLLAGGQGTRLGFPHPKGKYPIGPVSEKSLFELFAEQLIAVSNRVGRSIPYMIMTSDGTHDETVAFFEEHAFFGLNKDDIFFFKQGYAPSLDSKTGELLFAAKGSLSMSPDGHGGLLTALSKAGMFDEMHRRGIDIVYSHQVDNPLTKVCDPAFIGLHLRHNADVSTKVVAKTGPEEKVGVAVDLNGRTSIIEYSDLPTELANEREPNGDLKYWAGSTAIHVFSRAFLEGVATSAESLPWHRARKKIPYVDRSGNQVQPAIENGVKFERFLFDTMPLATTALIVETLREDEFAPLKNSTGDYSPDYVRKHISQVAKSWFAAMGIEVPENAVVEISPRFAISSEELANRSNELSGLTFEQPTYFGPTEMATGP